MTVDAQTVVIGSLIITEIVLTWRIWRLERQMMSVMQHFIKAKDFLGHIKDSISDYKGVAESITKNGLDVKLNSDKLGSFELNIKKGNGEKK